MHAPRSVLVAGVALALLLVVAGCGGGSSSKRKEDRALDAFFTRTQHGRTFGARFPHRTGSIACTVFDSQLEQRVDATCATDVEVDPTRLVVTFTESWSHGSRTRTWFVFLHPDGTIESITREGVAPSG
jgi:hypothetical protein